MVHNAKRPIALILAIMLCLGLCSAMVLPASAAGGPSEAPEIGQRYYWDPDVDRNDGETVQYNVYVKKDGAYQAETHDFIVHTTTGESGQYGVYKNLADIPANEDGVKQIFMFAKTYTLNDGTGDSSDPKRVTLKAFDGGCTYEFYGMKFGESPIVLGEDGYPSSERAATRTDDAQETILDGQFYVSTHVNVTLNGFAFTGVNRGYLRDHANKSITEVNEMNVVNCISTNSEPIGFNAGGYGVLSIVAVSGQTGGAQHTGEFSHNHLIADRDVNSNAATNPSAGFLLLNGIDERGFTVSDNYCENKMGVGANNTGYFGIRLADRTVTTKPFNLTVEGNTFINVAAIHNNEYVSLNVNSKIDVTDNKFEVNKVQKGTPIAFSMHTNFASDETAEINISGNVFSGYAKYFTNCSKDEYPDNLFYDADGQLISGESKSGTVSDVKLDKAGHHISDFDLTLKNEQPLTVKNMNSLSEVKFPLSETVVYDDFESATVDDLVKVAHGDKVQVKIYTNDACTEPAVTIEKDQVYYAKVSYLDETPLYAVYTIITGGTGYTGPKLYWDPAVAGKSNNDKVNYIVYEGDDNQPKAYLFTVGTNVFATVAALKAKAKETAPDSNEYDIYMFPKVYESPDPKLNDIGETGETYRFYGAKHGVSPVQTGKDSLPTAERDEKRSNDAYETILEMKSGSRWTWENKEFNVTMDGVAFAGEGAGILCDRSHNLGGDTEETIEMVNCMTVNGNGNGYTPSYGFNGGSGYGFVSAIRSTPHTLKFHDNYFVTENISNSSVENAYMVIVRSAKDVEVYNNYFNTGRRQGDNNDAAVRVTTNANEDNGTPSDTFKANIHNNTLNAEIQVDNIAYTHNSQVTIKDVELTIKHNKIDLPNCANATYGIHMESGTAAAGSTYKISITENIFTTATGNQYPILVDSDVDLSAAKTTTFEIKDNTFDNSNGAFQYPASIEGKIANQEPDQTIEVTGNTLIGFANGWNFNNLGETPVNVEKNLYLTTKNDQKVVTSVGAGSGFETPTTYYIDAAGEKTTAELAVSNEDAQVGSFENGMQNISMNIEYKCTPETFTVSEENKIVGVYTDPDLTTPLEEITYEESENTTVYVLVARQDDSIAVINKIDVTLTPCTHPEDQRDTQETKPGHDCQTGHITVTCKICGEILQDEDTPAKGEHQLSEEPIADKHRDSTCKTAGVDVYTCTECGEEVEEALLLASHEYADDYTVDTPATCGTAGSQSKHCKWFDECGQKESVEEIPATGKHTWDSGKVTVKATTTKEGVMTYTCTVCHTTKTESIPKLKPTVDSTKQFKDVVKGKWYVGAINFAVENNLFEGMDSTHFAPDGNMTRAMFVTVLGRLAGAKVNNKVATKFSDVPAGKWYTGYVKWASDNKIVEGDQGKFSPDDNVTREQICKMMVEYCSFAGIELRSVNKPVTFKDQAKVSKWAKKYVSQAQTAGFIEGDNGYFNPLDNATRAQVATIFMRFVQNYNAL